MKNRTPEEYFRLYFYEIASCKTLDILEWLECEIYELLDAGLLTVGACEQLMDEVSSKRSELIEQEL